MSVVSVRSSHLLLFLGLLLLAGLVVLPGMVEAKDSVPVPPVGDRVDKHQSNCLDLGGSHSVRMSGNRAISECQYADGDYTVCEFGPTASRCESLEMDIRVTPEIQLTPPTHQPETLPLPLTPVFVPGDWVGHTAG